MQTDIRRVVHWLFLAVTVLFFVSGLGITEYQAVEAATGGLLGKALSFELHTLLVLPFIALLALHVYLAVFRK